MPAREWPQSVWAAILLVIFGTLYITAAPSLAYQHWDSLEYAQACETRGPLATWGNHPLGQLIQCSAFAVATMAGATGRALPYLKVASAVTSAGAVAAFFVLLSGAIGLATLRAVGWAVVMGAAYGLWHYAGTADIYGISLFVLILAWDRVLRGTNGRPAGRDSIAVLAIALASLVHQYNVMMLGAGMAGLALFGRSVDRRRLFRLAAGSAVLATVGYVILGMFSLPTRSPLRVIKWIVGYGGDPTYGHSFGLRGLGPALHSISETFLRDPYDPSWRLVWGAAVLVGILVFVLGLARLGRLRPRDRPLVAATGLQLLVGWSLIVWWWPLMYGKWWILTLPLLILWWDRALAGAIDDATVHRPIRAAWLRRVATGGPIAAGVFALVFNYQAALRTERVPDLQFEQSLALWVARSAPEDVLIENGRLTAHLIFWSARPNAMNVYRVLQVGYRAGDPLGAVERVIDTGLRDGHQVLFAEGLDPYFFTNDLLGLVGVTRADLEDCFKRYRHDGPMFNYQEWPASPPTGVYRLERQGPRP